MKCANCNGHGHYWIAAEVAGTKNDKKKTCPVCDGVGVTKSERKRK